MAVSSDILGTWRSPRAVIARLLSIGPREDRSIAYLMAGCLLIFVAQWPRLSRIAYEAGTELDRLIAYEFLSWLVIWPLLFYGLAAALHAGMRLLRRRSAPWSARVALFWALLAASPAGLLYGLLSGLVGQTTGVHIVGAIWLVAFVIFVVQGLRAGEAHLAQSA